MREKVDYMHIILRGGLLAMVCALLSVVWVNDPMLPAGELSGQWLYLAKVAMGAAVGWVVSAFLYYRKGYDMGADFYQVVIWSFIVLAASEAIYGLRQLYGFTSSHHSLYSLTGSFFNPGPYSGYLAMIFPLCLDQWLRLRKRENKNWMEWMGYYGAVAVLFLILCVLPAGMSRSAWVAALISGIWVYGVHKSWPVRLKRVWMRKKTKVLAVTSVLCIVVLVGGVCLFNLKKIRPAGDCSCGKSVAGPLQRNHLQAMAKAILHWHMGQVRKLILPKGVIRLRKNWWQEVRNMLLMNICR